MSELTIELEDAQRMCAEPYDTRELAVAAGERLRRDGYRVNRILGERVREDGRAIRLATVLHPDVDLVPEPVGEITYLTPPRQVPQQRMAKDPGEP